MYVEQGGLKIKKMKFKNSSVTGLKMSYMKR